MRNNITENDVRDSSWKFDTERGQWLDNDAIARGDLDKAHEALSEVGI